MNIFLKIYNLSYITGAPHAIHIYPRPPGSVNLVYVFDGKLTGVFILLVKNTTVLLLHIVLKLSFVGNVGNGAKQSNLPFNTLPLLS